ncbi:AMP-binding protein [Brevibacillus choshinensis]|uniref:class I adenylate-forming enzyme family protein n=1 Tax=Brevibacillus choshinensis TaxID=54911 RepID=UPI002E1DBF99|nr:AMP-binding protein [Brevibacillus choshinensis]
MLPFRTIPEYLRHYAGKHPEKVAIVAMSGVEKRKTRLTYSQLDEITSRLANAFLELGIQKGERIGIYMGNEQGMECLVSFYSAHKMGAINVPINARYLGEELHYILEHCEATTLITSNILIPKVMEIMDTNTKLKNLIIVGNHEYEPVTGFEIIDFEALLGTNAPDRLPAIELTETDDADWIYTSGTTARPKGVMHTHRSAIFAGISVGGAIGIEEIDIYQSAFPFFTSSGCHFNALSVLVKGATFIMDRRFDREETFQTIQEERTTIYVGVPSVYTYMLDSGKATDYDLSSLRLLDYGGAPMPKQVILDLYKQFPAIELRQTYGLTEAGPTGTFLPGEFALLKLGSVGKEGMPMVDVKIVDENDQLVEPNVVGEICYRSPANMRGYFKNEEATKEALRDGWLHSGDLVYRDEDGFIFHVDRKKDVIIRGGFNISSLEVENCLYEHPAVLEVAAVGKPHKSLGEDILVFIVLRNGAKVDAQEIRDFCSGRLADFKVPRDVRFIDKLPKNPMGKVLKKELKGMV